MLSKILQESIADLFSKGEFEKVITKIEEFSSFEDRSPGLSSILGVCRMLKGSKSKNDLILALKDFQSAFNKSSDKNLSIEVLCNFISACLKNVKHDKDAQNYLFDAKKMFDKAENRFGYNEKLFKYGVDLYNHFCDHNKLKYLLYQLISNNCKAKSIACSYGFFNNYIYDWDIKDYYNYSKKFKNYFPYHEVVKLKKIILNKNKKIKIGFISCDFLNHSVGYFTTALTKNLDKNIFETYGIYLGSSRDNQETNLETVKSFDKWLNLSKYDNQQVINIIQKEKIEILIDQMGLTQSERIEIFNNRISPLQLSWNAFCNTVGFDTIDYIIVDNNLIYDSEQKFYNEKILKLKNIWNTHSGFKFERKKALLPYKKNNYITFGSFNNFLKISDNVIKVWSNILKNIKNSKLILKSSLSYNSKIILEKFKKFGVEDSIEILDRQNYPNLEDHLRLYQNIDIALDTFPYNGVTTSFEALWSGVPVICIKGFNFNSRCGESILLNADLSNFLATDENEYQKIAEFYSKNIANLELERSKIYNNILETPLFNAKIFSEDFKNSILSIYNRSVS